MDIIMITIMNMATDIYMDITTDMTIGSYNLQDYYTGNQQLYFE